MGLLIKQAIKKLNVITPPRLAEGKDGWINGNQLIHVTHNARKFGNLITLIFSVSLILGFMPGCNGAGVSDTEYVERAKDYHDKGNLQASIIELKNALLQNSANLEARSLLGNIYLETGNGASAEKELVRAQELGVAREGIILQLAKAFQLQGKHEQLINEIHPEGSLSTSDKAQVYAIRGNAYIDEGQFQAANEEFRLAYELEPHLAAVQVGQARLAAIQGNIEDARNLIEKAFASNPESAAAWSLLGDIELSTGNYTEAENAFSKAIGLRQYPTMDVAKRALVRIQLEKYAEADADIGILKESGFKNHPTVNYIKGISYFNQEKYPEAAEALQLSYNQNPSFLPVAYYLATAHYMLGNMEMANDLAKRLQAKAPESQVTNQLLGAIRINRSEYDDAIRVLLKARHKSADDVVILQMLATASLLKGDTKQAVNYYAQVVSLQPESTEAKNKLMLAKLMDGQALDTEIADDNMGTALREGGDYTQDLLHALHAFKNGDIGVALKQAKLLHEQYPDKVDPLKLMSACYLAAAQWDRARIELEKTLALKPNEQSTTRNLAIVEINEGNINRAKTLLKGLIEEYPQDEKAILLLVSIEDSLGNSEISTQLLEQAVVQNPDALTMREKLVSHYLQTNQINKVLVTTGNLTDKQLQEQPSFLELQGKAQMLGGDLTAARHSFKRWVKLVPDSAQAHFFYGDTLARSGEKKHAREQLEQAIKIDPAYLPARVGEIKMLVNSGEMGSARKALTDLKQNFGYRPEVLEIEGWFALGTGDYATAVDSLSAAAKKKPNTDTTILLVRALWAMQKQDEAIKVMQNWLKDRPRDIKVLLQLADGYLSLEKEEDAIKAYYSVVEVYPRHIQALNNLAWLNRDKNLKQAIVYAEKAYELAPNDPYVLDTYGMLLLKKGDTLRGHRMVQKAAKFSPKDLNIQLHLGHALIQQKRFDEAGKVLHDLVNKAPDTQSAIEAKALLESIPRQ